MANKEKEGILEDAFAIHQYYMDIINCMPNIVYWVDIHCKLIGCNNLFVKLLDIKSMNDFVGTPYDQMAKFSDWPKERIERFKLDDMAVLFSGVAKYNVEEPPVCGKKNDKIYYLANRIPLFDQDRRVIGLVVVLSDISHHKKAKEVQTNMQLREPQASYQVTHIPRILMVEDNFIAQKVAEAILTSLNCFVDIAESGEKALQLFEPGKYDIVFMDIGLEDTSGYMIAKKFRLLEENTDFHVPIIALTSYQADVVKYDCNEYFMEGVLSKPLTSEQAKQIIQHYIYKEDISVLGLKKC